MVRVSCPLCPYRIMPQCLERHLEAHRRRGENKVMRKCPNPKCPKYQELTEHVIVVRYMEDRRVFKHKCLVCGYEYKVERRNE